MKVITSLQNQVVKDAVSLHQKKYRDEFGLFLVEGREPCETAIAQGWEHVYLFVQSGSDVTVADDDRLLEVSGDILAKISKKDNPQPVIGIFRQRLATTPAKADTYLALEEIRDPGNLGTIMRTAHAVGMSQIILVGNCCDPFTPEVIRASMGSFSTVQLVTMSPDELLAWQSAQGYALLGTDVVDAKDYRETTYRNAILVMGNEQKGLSPALKECCTGRVHIPMPGGTESLNLSVATALLLYEQFRLN